MGPFLLPPSKSSEEPQFVVPGEFIFATRKMFDKVHTDSLMVIPSHCLFPPGTSVPGRALQNSHPPGECSDHLEHQCHSSNSVLVVLSPSFDRLFLFPQRQLLLVLHGTLLPCSGLGSVLQFSFQLPHGEGMAQAKDIVFCPSSEHK